MKNSLYYYLNMFPVYQNAYSLHRNNRKALEKCYEPCKFHLFLYKLNQITICHLGTIHYLSGGGAGVFTPHGLMALKIAFEASISFTFLCCILAQNLHLLKFFVPLFRLDRNCSSRLENTIIRPKKPHFGHAKIFCPALLIVPKMFVPLFYLCQNTSSRRKNTSPPTR